MVHEVASSLSAAGGARRRLPKSLSDAQLIPGWMPDGQLRTVHLAAVHGNCPECRLTRPHTTCLGAASKYGS
eukprot:2807491-Prymnesium_polylepis.1